MFMHSELKLRLKKLRAAGVFDKTDKLVFYNPESNKIDPNFTYLSGVEPEYSVLVVYPNSVTLYTVDMIAPRTRNSWAKVVVTDKLARVLKRALKGRVGVNGWALPYRIPKLFKSKPQDVSHQLETARDVKTAYEITQLRSAVAEAAQILNAVRIEQGKTEAEISAELTYETLKRGLAPSFETIVATGTNTASPHHVPTQATIKAFCYIDFGVRKNQYCSDLTRVFVFNNMYEKHVQHVQNVIDALEDHIRPGAKAADLHKMAERALKPYSKNFIHALGHGIGIEVHELPHVGAKSKDVLKEGMVIAIEPGFYLPNKFGVRIENNYLVTKNGCEKL